MEEDYALTQTQTASQVQRNLERFSGAQVDQKVSELVQFLLIKDQKKIPIRRADILKNVIKDYKEVYCEIINRASRTLQQVFGLQLVEIDTKHHIYILVSNLPRLDGENLKQDDRTAKLGLLTVILSFIYMKGNAAKESDVWEMLKKLQVEPGKRHKVFGNVRELVTVEFVQQKYLEYSRMPNTDLAEFQFQWGLRATKETSKMQILHFVAKIQSKDPTAWTSQYNEAAAAEALSHHTSAPGDAGGASRGARRRKQSAWSTSPTGATPRRLVNQQPLGAGASAHAEPSIQGSSGTLPLPS
ncbi:non-structural maintenance of chromosomes element 3 homolog isoform X3 [Lepidochelys kempii]|uniref:non-structural maintenance of chromosomes element 3 homolog isoform X3 n=1 Tax=Lepidochelys kempii TaxID=8472 RepID=UPI003C6F257A